MTKPMVLAEDEALEVLAYLVTARRRSWRDLTHWGPYRR
jgi:hypothetical protein